MKIYIIMGHTGCMPSEEEVWIVRAYTDEGHAQRDLANLQYWCRYNNVDSSRDSIRQRKREADGLFMPDFMRDLECPLDPNIKCDWDGIEYKIEEHILVKEE
jgi:hypothetical protein